MTGRTLPHSVLVAGPRPGWQRESPVRAIFASDGQTNKLSVRHTFLEDGLEDLPAASPIRPLLSPVCSLLRGSGEEFEGDGDADIV